MMQTIIPQTMQAGLSARKSQLIKNYEFQLIAILASLISSYIALSYHQPFNVDGIIYLNAATAFLQGGLHQAFSVYHWPFYPIVIALVSKITHLHTESAAFLLNCALNTLTFVTFITLIKEFGGSRRVQFFGLLIILIYPYLNHDRDNILRDFGYYAFALLSLLYFIRYLRFRNWHYALLWSSSIFVAALFRVEGFVILACAPFAVLLQRYPTFKAKILSFLQINCLSFVGITLAITYLLLFHRHDPALAQQISNFTYYFQQYTPSLLLTSLNDKVTVLQQGLFSDNDFVSIPIFLLTGAIGIFLDSFINAIGLLYLGLSYYALRYHLVPADRAAALAWLTYVLLNLLIVISFLISAFFLATRYVALLSLLLILATPFSLVAIYENWRQQKPCFTGKKWVFPLICVFLGALAIDSIGHFGPSKAYITSAGSWIDNHTASSARLFSNDAQLIYYSHRTSTEELLPILSNKDPLFILQNNDLKNYNYLALLLRHDELIELPKIIAFLQSHPIQTFQNQRGDTVLIFELNKQASTPLPEINPPLPPKSAINLIPPGIV